MTAADYIELIHARRAWIESVDEKTQEFDALLMPTVPIVAPPIKDLEASDDLYFATNRVVLRNPTLINFWDGCAVSLPCHRPGEAPVGLMVAGRALQDHHILQTAATLEALLQPLTDQHEPNRA
ncbi:Aspartyl-tRNA(Asn)/glutamyl-tRNA(Gln) amidotransferase subunit A OS=Castellaniella defragrans OX=75697 GN=HNR28_001829 PE=4 SV=1 [Castellaniella defragrans]